VTTSDYLVEFAINVYAGNQQHTMTPRRQAKRIALAFVGALAVLLILGLTLPTPREQRWVFDPQYRKAGYLWAQTSSDYGNHFAWSGNTLAVHFRLALCRLRQFKLEDSLPEWFPGVIYCSGSRTGNPGVTMLFIGLRRGVVKSDCYLTDSANHRVPLGIAIGMFGYGWEPETAWDFDLPKGLTNLCGYTIHIVKRGSTNDCAVLHVR